MYCPLSRRPHLVRSDLETVPDEVFESAILKPRDSQPFFRRFGVKACHVRSRDHAATKVETLFADGFPVILQEYIPGPATNHYFIDGFIDRSGTLRAIFVRRRLRMYPLDFGNSTAMVSVPVAEAAPAVASISALLQYAHYRGIFSAEFKRDSRDGVFKLVEVNTRPWWYVDFAARCGVDVVKLAYDDARGLDVDGIERYSVGRRLVFPYQDFFACVHYWRKGELSLRDWLTSWIGAMQPVFQFRDPAPGLGSFLTTMSRFLRSRVRRLFADLISHDA